MITSTIYETERLLLRPSTEEDADMILELFNSPKWKRYVGERKVNTLEDAAKYIRERMMPQLHRLGFSNNTVIRKSDGAKLGCCGLYDREGLDGVDIGYGFLPQYEGHGYAFEAACRVKQLGIEDFGIKEILGITAQENLASQKILLKLGLREEGLISLPGETKKLLLYRWKLSG
ncbi:GNAT family N-acetyltransferase [Salinimicrobium soli]|uniref:GNAT family N-acetyltransferase n=1 Tax=Salinimicrobium soli TaxID=1254399 RepID=UPI003AADE21D